MITPGYPDLVALYDEVRRFSVKVPAAEWFNAYSYLRFSKAEQAEGDSIRRQLALRDAWLARNPNARLDTRLQFVDKGVSAFRGANRKNLKFALAQFVDLVKRGRVPSGSYLLIENLDRLVRENPVESVPAVLELIQLGVLVVAFTPSEMVYHRDMDQMALMNLLWELSRAHGESKRKSEMNSAAWEGKRQRARERKDPHGAPPPAWIEETEDGYRVKEDAGGAVRAIYRWAIEGMGSLAITQRLRDEKVPTIGRSAVWIRSYVQKILENRAVLGEYQPRKGNHHREDEGDPIPDYYPRVISDADWHLAQQSKQVRNKRSGRPGKKGTFVSPFSGLLMCARDRCKIHVITRKGRKLLLSYRAVNGEKRCPWVTFPLDVFAAALLSRLKELEATDLFADPGAGKVADLTGRLGEVERRLAAALVQFEADPESPTWAGQVSKYDKEKRRLVGELEAARREAANPLSAAWADAVALMAEEEPERLRAALLGVVQDIWCLFIPHGQARLAFVQVWFKGEEPTHRDYVLWHKPPVAGCRGKGARPAEARIRVGDTLPATVGMDLRDEAQARELAELLAGDDLP